MTTVVLLDKTREFLDEALPDETDLDAKVRQLIQREYLRELGRYRRADLAFARKYDLSFEEFITRHVTQQMAFSWEVEQDAMAWETAIGGIATMERKLKELQELGDEPTA